MTKDSHSTLRFSLMSRRCCILDEPYFACKSSLVVKQVRWHPASPNSTHLVVLTTDDTLRLYDVQDMSLKTVWHPGRAFSSSLSAESSFCRGMQTLASLGETAIDFDFTPPVIVVSTQFCYTFSSLLNRF